jgi:hypothetical protein
MKKPNTPSAFSGQGAAGALIDFIEAVRDPAPRPNLVPREFVPELDRLSRGELMDVAWHLARTIHDLADDPQGDMGELRVAIDYVEWLRRPRSVKLRKREP